MSTIAAPPYIFTQGFPDKIYLPIDGSGVDYTVTLNIGLSGEESLDRCYDKYGVLWRWSTFETGGPGISALSSTRTPFPSSWNTVSCFTTAGALNYGPYPKRWVNETPLSANLFNKFAVDTACTAKTITFILSTLNWISPPQINAISATNSAIFNLSLTGNGTTVNTVSRFEPTVLTLYVNSTGTCTNVGSPTPSGWDITIYRTLTAYPPPDIKIYTPNRLVLSGTTVVFENISTGFESVTSLFIDLDDGKTVTLTGSQVVNDLEVSYDVLGFKTIRATALPPYGDITITKDFPNIIEVLEEYDTVSPTEYRTQITPIQLPWSEQPQVYSNDWVVEDNINSCFKKFYENLNYLETRGRSYNTNITDYFGYLGQMPFDSDLLFGRCYKWTWQDLDCLNTNLPYTVTWADVLSSLSPVRRGVWTNASLSGNCGTWNVQKPLIQDVNISCFEKYCTEWKWKSRTKASAAIPITWKQSVSSGEYAKRWQYQPCGDINLAIDTTCNAGVWNVNIPGIDTYYNPIANCTRQFRCFYSGIASKNNQLYLTKKIQVEIHTKEYNFSVSFLPKLFSNIKNVCIDSQNKIYFLDSTLSQVLVYTYSPDTPGEDWELFTAWGGIGTSDANSRFFNPNDIHIDQLDNIWISDTGNNVVKHYSNSGSWIQTIRDSAFVSAPPLSLCVDSQKNVHILTKNEVRVYTYEGIFNFAYTYDTNIPGAIRINSSYNREVIYIISSGQAGKYFRNGVFYGYIISQKDCVTNITAIYQDEYRNVLITVDDKILKYADIMTLDRIKDTLPSSYWSLKDLYIHKNEYIQNWVYTKSFQRLWDNIEIFRNTLYFSSGNCKSYIGPVHSKDKMVIGQNEIVTSTAVNRVLGYLWDNFKTLINYFDPDCIN